MSDLIITIDRIIAKDKKTYGVLRSEKHILVTCEDQYNAVKIPGSTRINQGLYEIKLRTEGALLKTYQTIYKEHPGMLWLQNVLNFVYVYIHHGNNEEDTDGCVLVGLGIDLEAGIITQSRVAYERLYREIQQALAKDRKVWLKIVDRDRGFE